MFQQAARGPRLRGLGLKRFGSRGEHARCAHKRATLFSATLQFDPSIPCLGEITLFSLDKEINADLRASSGVSKNARSMPDHFTSEKEYLTSMQAHAEREYFVSAWQALLIMIHDAEQYV
eukprot:1138730-Pelagomonas_calceolata.AAC.2